MSQFVKKLHEVAESGALNTTDLSRWLDVPYSTVWQWLHGGREISADREIELTPLLQQLERAIKQGLFPVPYAHQTQSNRATYIGMIRDGHRTRLSAPYFAGRRLEVRNGGKR